MKKKIAVIMLGMVLGMQMTACAGKSVSGDALTDNATQEETDEEASEIACVELEAEEEESGDIQESISIEEEQQMAQAQLDADEIREQHTQEETELTQVDAVGFDRVVPHVNAQENWMRVECSIDESGLAKEKYKCDEELMFLWESGQKTDQDIQSAFSVWSSEKEWNVTECQRNDELSSSLQCEVYDYQALEDDQGYSMYHKGVYLITDTYWYDVDFNVIEGVYVDYFDTITSYISSMKLM